MTKYIDTWQGNIAVESMAGIEDDDTLYVVNVPKVRDILDDPDHMPGVYQRWLVKDEDAFLDKLKERLGEHSTNHRRGGRGTVFPLGFPAGY